MLRRHLAVGVATSSSAPVVDLSVVEASLEARPLGARGRPVANALRIVEGDPVERPTTPSMRDVRP